MIWFKRHQVHKSKVSCIWSLSLLISVAGCGQGGKKKSSGPSNRPVSDAISQASHESGVPVEIIASTVYYESGVSAEVASAPLTGDSSNTQMGLSFAETAVGLSKDELFSVYEQMPSDADKLPVQIVAYGKWLKSKLSESGFSLSSNQRSAEEVTYRWVWALSRLHRPGDELSRPLQYVWTEGLVRQMNEGFIWQDSKTKEELNYPPRKPLIKSSDRPVEMGHFGLITDEADIRRATRIYLPSENSQTTKNRPRKILVTHCPFNFAACLQLQDSGASGAGIRMGAHYLIPAPPALSSSNVTDLPAGGFGSYEKDILSGPVQVLSHSSTAVRTNSNGVNEEINDTIVVMLVGQSGRYVNGIREQANPTWYTSEQLHDFGVTVASICFVLAENGVNAAQCKSDRAADGIRFQGVEKSYDSYWWGDVVDFERDVFMGFLEGSDGLPSAAVDLEMVSNKPSYEAGETITLRARFSTLTAKINFQQSVRKRDGSLVWEVIRSENVRHQNNFQIDLRAFDGGPNGDGKHYLRAVAVDRDGVFLGWDVASFFLRNFDASYQGLP